MELASVPALLRLGHGGGPAGPVPLRPTDWFERDGKMRLSLSPNLLASAWTLVQSAGSKMSGAALFNTAFEQITTARSNSLQEIRGNVLHAASSAEWDGPEEEKDPMDALVWHIAFGQL